MLRSLVGSEMCIRDRKQAEDEVEARYQDWLERVQRGEERIAALEKARDENALAWKQRLETELHMINASASICSAEIKTAEALRTNGRKLERLGTELSERASAGHGSATGHGSGARESPARLTYAPCSSGDYVTSADQTLAVEHSLLLAELKLQAEHHQAECQARDERTKKIEALAIELQHRAAAAALKAPIAPAPAAAEEGADAAPEEQGAAAEQQDAAAVEQQDAAAAVGEAAAAASAESLEPGELTGETITENANSDPREHKALPTQNPSGPKLSEATKEKNHSDHEAVSYTHLTLPTKRIV
eukprot:TRINITY_DN13396_c0_g2_i1.p1 TRINITY_DN13396_c0_g2~~TRINITY_DN13396_c0_g2_i1.p1  ORF type:complete len:339 (-),score=77.95 TRINITY_DN13396_c0_g2_i1:132-1046(-)